MKKIIPAAIIIAACAFIVACKWFKNDVVHQPFSIVGTWKLDSTYLSGELIDSSKSLFAALFAQTRTNPISLNFKTDSTVIDLLRKDTTAYYLKDSTVFIKEDSSFSPYHLNITSDSLISLTATDSLVLVLKKQ